MGRTRGVLKFTEQDIATGGESERSACIGNEYYLFSSV